MTTFISLGSPAPLRFSWIIATHSGFYMHAYNGPPVHVKNNWSWRGIIEGTWKFPSKEEAERWVLDVYYARYPEQKASNSAISNYWVFIRVIT